MEKMLNDRVAIITVSGRGIGCAVALMFAQEGAKVVVGGGILNVTGPVDRCDQIQKEYYGTQS